MAKRKGTKPIKLVRQEEAAGCGIACVAMVMGRTYQQVRKDWHNDFEKHGVTSTKLIAYLGDIGCSILYKVVSNWVEKDFARAEMIKPFAPYHIVGCKSAFDAEIGHWVVMDRKGKFFCPGGHSDAVVRAAYLFDEVIGIYK